MTRELISNTSNDGIDASSSSVLDDQTTEALEGVAENLLNIVNNAAGSDVPLEHIIGAESELVHDSQAHLLITREELKIVRETDSRSYGIVELSDPANAHKKTVILKAITYMEAILEQQQSGDDDAKRQKMTENAENGTSSNGSAVEGSSERTSTVNGTTDSKVDPKLYCKLGHLHLVNRDFARARVNYEEYQRLKEDHWKDPCFLYGLGQVYFAYQAYNMAVKHFQQILYNHPTFSHTKEVHFRIALIYKVIRQIPGALKHFDLVLGDESPNCTCSKYEVRFQLAHLYEGEGQYVVAKEEYLRILKDEEHLPKRLKADIYR